MPPRAGGVGAGSEVWREERQPDASSVAQHPMSEVGIGACDDAAALAPLGIGGDAVDGFGLGIFERFVPLMRALRALAIGAVAALSLAACGFLPETPVGPAGGPQVICQGVPQVACRQSVGTIGPEMGAVVQVVVRCMVPICTDATGEAELTIRFADGRTETSGYGWASAPGPAQPQAPPEPPRVGPDDTPPLRIQPTCVGVPTEMCTQMASGGPEGAGVDDTVRAITVRCSAVCTPIAGQGQTTYEFVDRRAPITHDWIYENGD